MMSEPNTHPFSPPGREWSDWSSELRIPGDELKWKFISDGSVNGWGWRFTVYPIMPAAGEEGADCDQGSVTQARGTHMSFSLSTFEVCLLHCVGNQHCSRPHHSEDQNCNKLPHLSSSRDVMAPYTPQLPQPLRCWCSILTSTFPVVAGCSC